MTILGPGSGAQACGETGMGRMLEAHELAASVRVFFGPRLLQGKRVLVTAGPTYEAIDAVRGITNLSSGKMGYAVARAAVEAGADVILISGPVCLTPPAALKLVSVTSAEEMLAAVKDRDFGRGYFCQRGGSGRLPRKNHQRAENQEDG